MTVGALPPSFPQPYSPGLVRLVCLVLGLPCLVSARSPLVLPVGLNSLQSSPSRPCGPRSALALASPGRPHPAGVSQAWPACVRLRQSVPQNDSLNKWNQTTVTNVGGGASA